MEEQDYIEKWFNGTLSEKERLVFEQTDTYHMLNKMDKSLQRFKAPDYDVEAGKEKLKAPRQAIVVSFWRQQVFLKVAASLLFVLGAAVLYFLVDRNKEIEFIAAGKTSTYLPDSSFVSLNTASTLKYRPGKWAEGRTVVLEGEGFFKVSKGTRFDVQTSEGVITVLGTAFNVKARADFFEVVCYEGSVRVQSNGKELVLNKNQGWRRLGSSSSNITLQSVNQPDWLKDESSFKSVPYIQVIKEFERQYNMKVKTERIDLQQLFTGTFTHTDRELALKSITFPLNIKFVIKEDLVRLSGDL